MEKNFKLIFLWLSRNFHAFVKDAIIIVLYYEYSNGLT